jgi:hypothetical protein
MRENEERLIDVKLRAGALYKTHLRSSPLVVTAVSCVVLDLPENSQGTFVRFTNGAALKRINVLRSYC